MSRGENFDVEVNLLRELRALVWAIWRCQSVTGLFHFYLRDNLSLRIVPAVAVSGCGFPSPLSTFFELCAMFAPNDLTQFL